jgi:acylphosphatase
LGSSEQGHKKTELNKAASERYCLKVQVKGKVQGVFFRSTLKARADELGVTGWVRNREDGAVEAILRGTREQLERLVGWCACGPENARVESMHAERITCPESYKSFAVVT